MGNVIAAGLGQNPARQAAIFAGLPDSVGALTVNKVCGSGLKAVMLADQAIRAGDASLIVAGGMESMSRATYLLTKAREGYRLGHGELLDSMILDGLWDVYGRKHMGSCGETCAETYHFSRTEQDDFAVRSHTRARQAIAAGAFDTEIVPIDVSSRGKTTRVSVDEGSAKFDEAKLRSLAPAFSPHGSITAGNASSISDGAAALLIASPEQCRAANLKPLAVIKGAATWSQQPEWFTTAPVAAIRLLLEKLKWTIEHVDLFEINEAFAVVTMVAERELGIPGAKGEHSRRSGCARPSDRMQRRPDPRHPAECPQAHWRAPWHRQPLHRRRRGRRTCRRDTRLNANRPVVSSSRSTTSLSTSAKSPASGPLVNDKNQRQSKNNGRC